MEELKDIKAELIEKIMQENDDSELTYKLKLDLSEIYESELNKLTIEELLKRFIL